MRIVETSADASPVRGRCVLKSTVPALFDTTLLTDESAVDAAIGRVEALVAHPVAPLKDIVVELFLAPSKALEFVLAAVDEATYLILRETFLQLFPKTSHELVGSIAQSLLARFPLFFLIDLPDGRSIQSLDLEEIRKRRYHTETGTLALQVLLKSKFDDADPDIDGLLEDFNDSEFAVRRKRPGKKKQAKRGNQMSEADKKTILRYASEVPVTIAEAVFLCDEILEGQLEILMEYLNMFRDASIRPLIQSIYNPSPDPTNTIDDVPVKAPEDNANIEEKTSPNAAPEHDVSPLVLPMKAALYFDSADGFGEWRILISTRADGDLRQARKRDKKMFKIYVKKIRELSNGHFSDDNQKRLTGLNVEIPIYEAKMTGDTRLVYQVDCIPEFESSVERQVLKIFGIYTHAQLDRRFWDCISRHLEKRGAEYKKRCTYRNPPVNRGDNVYTPACWPPAEPVPMEPLSGLHDMRTEDMEEIHSLLVLEKFVIFSQALLNSILADQEIAHVFNVTGEERRIIEHPSSCFVLGRSGTGKTTTMLFKMLGIERVWEGQRETMPKPRQLFVTQSRVLAEKVEEYFNKLLDSLAAGAQSKEELAEMVKRKTQQQEQGLVDRDEEIYWRGDLPKRYGALEEKHFPMFVTFDHICRLLESEFHYMRYTIEKEEAVSKALQESLVLQDAASRDEHLSNDYMQQRRTSFVSFGTFLEEYWSHFPQSLTKGLDPTLVFGEFMGVIKGSELALDKEGYLDQATYHSLSHRTQGTFANQREGIYTLFKAYMKRKKERGDYDAADRTHALIKSLKAMGVPGQEIDFIYVDEAQDNLLIDALILRRLCHNPNGMFWAGDTAQTISVGSAFRFNDLKSFLYRYEEANSGQSGVKQDPPESFHLAVNYRSHGGIVNCADSVIQLITEFWPHAIDALAQETGMIDGIKPVFFSGWDQNTVRYEQFLFGESGSHIEFGAQQCILVRDDTAREKLRAQIGDIGLIMTLYESKGLEFNDVLLYNFFEDSTMDVSQWRVVLNALPPEERSNHPAPRFDDARHSGICRDLKFLYVAITRARKNLWIADGSEKGEPMRIVWTYKDQIQNCTPGTDVPRLAMSSTAEDWAKTALSLFQNRRYMQAMHCYDRAGLPRERAAAHAYYLREVARTTPVTRGDASAKAAAFVIAAEAFVSSARDAVTEKKAYYRIAAECYVQSDDDYKAAQAYNSAAEYTLAAQHFRKAGKFDEAVGVIQSHKDKVTPTVAESIIDVSRLYFLREKQIKKARALFQSDDEALEYMDDYGLDVVRASFLEDMNRFSDAAELHLAEGNILEAIRLLMLDTDNKFSIKKAFDCLLDGLWQRLSCGVSVSEETLKNNTTLSKLLRMTERIEVAEVDDGTRDEILMFRAIAKHEMQALVALAGKFKSRNNNAATFLCLDRVFSIPLKLQVASLQEIASKLEIFFFYVRQLRQLAVITTPCDNLDIRKLFAVQTSTEDLFILQNQSLLATQCAPRLTPNARVGDSGTILPRSELDRLIKFILKDRLVRRVDEETNILYHIRPLQPCLPFSVFGQCNRTQCPRQHLAAENHDAATYNIRIRVHVLQILISNTTYGAQHGMQQVTQQEHLLRLLYDAVFPSYYKLGGLHALEKNLIPEWEKVQTVVMTWIQDLLFNLDPRKSIRFLSSLTRFVHLGFALGNPQSLDYLSRVPCIAISRPPALLREGRRAYVVHDLLSLLHDNQPVSLERGVLFMNHILENRIAIDIGLLCYLMDYLCVSMIFAFRLHKFREPLHDVTLPKSWLLRNISRYDSLRSRTIELSWSYLRNMGALLEQIYSGVNASYLLYENRDLSDIGYHVKNTYFVRVCKNICLWAYNHRDPEIRRSVVRAISVVRQYGRVYHSSIEGYVNGRHWDHLSRVVRSSTVNSTMDEMVQLHHGSFPVPPKQLPNVRRVVFNRVEDIPFLLKTGASSTLTAGLRANATPFIPAGESAKQMEAEVDIDVEEPQILEDENEDGPEHVVDEKNITQAIDAEYSAAVAPAGPTAEEIAAAAKITTVYKRYLARTRVRKSTPIEEMRRRIFASFVTQALVGEWSQAQRHYRVLFRGPAAHLLVAVELMKNHLHEARSTARKRFNIAKHLELETMQTSMTQMSRLFKDALRLHQALAPTGDIHRARDFEQLKATTIEVEALMRSLPPSATQECEKDMKIALKGIVAVRKVPAKLPKPELNMDEGLNNGSTECADDRYPEEDTDMEDASADGT